MDADPTPLTNDERVAIRSRLERLDRSSGHGPWTQRTLRLVGSYPGVGARVLARHIGRGSATTTTRIVNTNMAKLEQIGLTGRAGLGHGLTRLGADYLGIADLNRPNVDGPNVDGPNVDGPNVDGPNLDGPNQGMVD
ncbi:unannotated protein [freshwater metagenome]|uniref:Unannotated protein n=1 Tax=freshwater metagenome TaxID=449393 RepID=A0A6J7DYY1_9ZZZZ|nr:hypothetical protein [Actinomycetota bacterium]